MYLRTIIYIEINKHHHGDGDNKLVVFHDETNC